MRTAAVFIVAPRRAEVREIDVGDPAPCEVQVRCVANGICLGEVSLFNDVETHRWPLPRIVGHEGVGVVTKVGAGVTTHREGDWVVCREWARDWNRPAAQATRLSRPPPDPATFLAEPCECVVNALHACPVEPGDRVCLVGAGFMGLLNLQALRRTLASHVLVLERNEARHDLARAFGAHDVRAATDEADRFDLAIEAAGAPAALDLATRLVRPGGRLSLFAWHHRPTPVALGDWHLKGLRVANTAPAVVADVRRDFMARTVALMERGVFDLSRLVTHRHAARDAQAAMELASARPTDYIKGALDFSEL